MLKCHIVRQLLPNYVDDLLDAESKRDVECHLSACSECPGHLEALKLQIVDSASDPDAESRKIDYLKKYKKKNTVTALLVLVAALAFTGMFLKLFVWGFPVKSEDLSIHGYPAMHAEEGGAIFLLDFELTNGGRLHLNTRYLEGPDGRLTGVVLTPRAVVTLPFDEYGSQFQYGYHLSSGENFRIQVRMSDEKFVYDMRDWVEN